MTRRGFTLLELMISLTVGGLAITSIYAIGATATRTFHQQTQIAASQSSLRNAVNQVKRDIARAGYLFTATANPPAGYAPETCGPVTAPLEAPAVSGHLAAISRYNDNVLIVPGVNGGIDPTGNNAANGFSADEIVLFGNYETSSEYSGLTLIDSNTISINPNWQNYRRDFGLWANDTPDSFDAARFNEAFTVGRLIRIQTTRGKRHYAVIRAVTAPSAMALAEVQITFAPQVPPSCSADVAGGWVAPISAIRYYVRDMVIPADRANTSGEVAQLVRTEVDPNDKLNPLPDRLNDIGTATRAVLDYLVAFNLAFTMNAPTALDAPDNYVPGTLLGGITDNIAPDPASQLAVNNNPERVRAVTIEIAVRAAETDTRMPFGANCARMRCFQVATTEGAARVRRERAEVFLPNVAYEGY